MGIPIVGKFFAAAECGRCSELTAYLAALSLEEWRPDFVVLHNTGAPTLAQRPQGLTSQHIQNLADYYAELGWHAGPHFFVDQNGVHVFSRPDRPGVHSPSWNAQSWGVEMLGDYDTERFDAGPGAAVARNAIALLAALHRRAALDSHTLHLHRWDPKTTHRDCPGKGIVALSVIQRLHAALVQLGETVVEAVS